MAKDNTATADAILSRLTYILGDDKKLAQTVYDYAVLGHLSYHNQLRSRLARIPSDGPLHFAMSHRPGDEA